MITKILIRKRGEIVRNNFNVLSRDDVRPCILIVDDEPSVVSTLEILLGERYNTLSAYNGKDAIDMVRTRHIDLVLLDVNMPTMDGLKALRMIKEIKWEVGVLIISALDSASKAVEALKLGAFDYITKPFEEERLLETVDRYVKKVGLCTKVDEELFFKFHQMGIISRSPRMNRVFELIEKVSSTSSNVLITGESGTGKELVARAIHMLSSRRNKPFVAVNCGAVPSELMESELFGYEKGAFTGAHSKKIGKFEYADGGTVFLDEISTLPLHLQIKLLRVLQERSFERVGGNEQIKVNIRIIAATNTSLEDAVSRGTFREDLYYRLKVVPIELPPLRERKEDIPLLVQYFMELHSKECRKDIKGIAPDVLGVLQDYHWPGNVRELENLIERLVVLAKNGEEISIDELPSGVFSQGVRTKDQAFSNLREACRAFERNYIINVLNRTNWNQMAAANLMKVHRNTLLIKMKTLGIKDLKPRAGKRHI